MEDTSVTMNQADGRGTCGDERLQPCDLLRPRLMQRWACGVANGTGSAAFTNDVVAERITNKLINLEQIYTDSVSPVDVSVFSLVTL